ncbi:MAG: hypothetical protein OXB84_01710, partial [Halobacteriovoraceae bacterium]|nr:hypothetical protein [Halobacteriovoraceae bacterium]
MRRQYFYLILAMLFVGCAQDRPVRFVQNDDANLTAVRALDGHRFPVKTLGEIKGAKTSAASDVEFEKKYTKVNALNFVKFESEAVLLQKDILFRALPNTEGIYSVCYEVNDTHVVVHKVAKPEFIPSQELTYKRTNIPCLEEGEVAIPLSGYSVNLYRTDRRLDANEERTHLIQKVPVQTKGEAEYLIYNPAGRVDFDAITKVDIFPSDFFTGSSEEEAQWFYSNVLIKTSRRASVFNALQGRELPTNLTGFRDISRIRFKKENNSIRGIDANIAEEIEQGTEGDGGDGGGDGGEGSGDGNQLQRSNEVAAIEIPVNWVDFKVQTVNGRPVLKEELLDEGHREVEEDFKKRKFVRINFAQINKNHFEARYRYFPRPTLEKIEVGDGYFSITITYSQYP